MRRLQPNIYKPIKSLREEIGNIKYFTRKLNIVQLKEIKITKRKKIMSCSEIFRERNSQLAKKAPANCPLYLPPCCPHIVQFSHWNEKDSHHLPLHSNLWGRECTLLGALIRVERQA